MSERERERERERDREKRKEKKKESNCAAIILRREKGRKAKNFTAGKEKNFTSFLIFVVVVVVVVVVCVRGVWLSLSSNFSFCLLH